MAARYYVTTSALGVERTSEGDVEWALPDAGAPLAAETTFGERLVLRSADALLDVLEEAVYVAEPLGEAVEELPGSLVVTSARLLQQTGWAPRSAAEFALDCAGHVLGEAGDLELPTGFTLAAAIEDARNYLSRSSGDTGRIGRLARLAAARRLRKEGERIGDLALAALQADLAEELDATSDRAWTLLTATGDAVLAAVETLRYLASPGYIAAREENAEHAEAAEPGIEPTLLQTPFGPVMLGAEHQSPYLSAGALARDAAFRAREAAGEASSAEREWQVGRLEQALGA
ncbi:MAG TPA: hypothetical protein VNF07_07575 [Acidimicrobiales bacterium]|nr:hypothetical protein [Acidimicrobiales bacterium]